MADLVLRRSEEMLPQFEQMQRVGLFNDAELKSIIKKTRAFEYKVARLVKEKKDILSYVQYKIHLLALIKKRRKKINYYFKKDEIEFAIVREVHRLFKKCAFLWPEDLKLWLSHVEFCKEWNKKVQLSKIWTSILQIHGSKNPHLWAVAAKWELEENLSVENARKIFLQGIRHHEGDPKLWHEYFRMELIHTQKLRQRLSLLTEGEKDNEEIDDSLLKGEAARIVYNNGIESIRNDVKFKCGFLEVALLFSYFAGDILNMIIEDLVDNHSDHHKARAALARLHLHPTMKTQSELADSSSDITEKADALRAQTKCCEEFESAVEELDTPEMWGEYFSYLHEALVDSEALQDTDTKELGFEITGSKKRKMAGDDDDPKVTKFLDVAHRAHKALKLNPDQYLTYTDLLVKTKKYEEALHVLNQANANVDSLQLRIKELELMVKYRHEQTTPEEVGSRFSSVVPETAKMGPKQDSAFWGLWMEYCMLMKDQSLALAVISDSFKFKSACSDDIQSSYLEWHTEQYGIDDTLVLYKTRVTASRPASLRVLMTLIQLLKACPDDRSVQIASYFEDGLSNYGRSEPSLWLDYISYMLKTDPTKVGNIHWRATKTLDPNLVEKFVTGYTLLQTSEAQQ